MFKNKSVIVTHYDTTLWDVCPDFVSERGKLFKLTVGFKMLQNSWHHSGKPEVKITLNQKVAATSATIIQNGISTEMKRSLISLQCIVGHNISPCWAFTRFLQDKLLWDCNIGRVKGMTKLFLFKIKNYLSCWYALNNPTKNGVNMSTTAKLTTAGVSKSREAKWQGKLKIQYLGKVTKKVTWSTSRLWADKNCWNQESANALPINCSFSSEGARKKTSGTMGIALHFCKRWK